MPPLGSRKDAPGSAGDVLLRTVKLRPGKAGEENIFNVRCLGKQCHRAGKPCRTTGCERGPCRAGCHASPYERRGSNAVDTMRFAAVKLRRIHRVCWRGCCAGEHATAGQRSFSQLRLSVIQAKAIRFRCACKAAVLSSTLFESTKPNLAWQQRSSSEIS